MLCASRRGSAEMIQILLNNGANVYDTDKVCVNILSTGMFVDAVKMREKKLLHFEYFFLKT